LKNLRDHGDVAAFHSKYNQGQRKRGNEKNQSTGEALVRSG
jgi:hypothetical protein